VKLWVTLSLFVLIVLCGLLLWSSSDFDQTSEYRFPFTQQSNDNLRVIQRLPMTFAHADHTKQQCVACHHNYQDDTGQGLCLDCHRTDHDIAFKMKDQFHDLCMGCHIDKRTRGEDGGPLRHCNACHTADLLP